MDEHAACHQDFLDDDDRKLMKERAAKRIKEEMELFKAQDEDARAQYQGWEFYYERSAALIRRDGLMCERHPGLEFEHDPDCGGPGQAWAIEGKANILAALRAERELILSNLYTEEGDHTLVAKNIAEHAAFKMKNAIIEQVRAAGRETLLGEVWHGSNAEFDYAVAHADGWVEEIIAEIEKVELVE